MSIRSLSRVLVLSAMGCLLLAAPAFAATGAPDSLGGVLNNVTQNISGGAGHSGFMRLLTAFAYIAGIWFAAEGIIKFKDHVDAPAHHPLSAGVKRFFAGGMLFALPYMSSAIKGSLVGNGGGAFFRYAGDIQPVAGSEGADKMIIDFIGNFANPATQLLVVFSYIAAIIFLINGITRLTKTAQEGPRGPAGFGTIMTFIVSGALFSFGNMIGTFSTSLFGDATVSNIVDINPESVGTDVAAAAVPFVQSIMVFVIFVGFVAFLRGWFVLKAFADGSQQASLAQALTFLVGGTIAINLGAFVEVLEKTLGICTVYFGGGACS